MAVAIEYALFGKDVAGENEIVDEGGIDRASRLRRRAVWYWCLDLDRCD